MKKNEIPTSHIKKCGSFCLLLLIISKRIAFFISNSDYLKAHIKVHKGFTFYIVLPLLILLFLLLYLELMAAVQ